ncbi:MAG: hypothetical protein ACNS62_22865 [Candidatus Cyclobacteriaceae bacterium M3_2C_046]
MPEEIFRFSVVRNPRSIPVRKVKTSIIHLIDESSEKYTVYHEFLGLKQKGEKRESYIQIATRKLNQSFFIHDLSGLKTNIHDYTDWIFAQKKPEFNMLLEKAKLLFGNDLSKFVKSDEFKKDKYRISDSIIVTAIVKPRQNGLRSELMKARRIVFLLEYLADKGADNADLKTIRTILKATILLPGALFPIPTKNNELRKQNEEALKIRKDKIEKSISEINKTTEKLRINHEAIEELTKTYSSHLFEIKNSPPAANNAKTSLSVMPVAKFNKLSSDTKNLILKDIGVSDKTLDIPFIVKSIEKENNILFAKAGRGIGDIELLNPNDVAVEVKKTCGNCAVVVVEDIKKENNFTGNTKGKVNKICAQEMEMVRQKLLKYEPGEIAHIENILKGEFKSKKHRKLHRTEEAFFEESERSEEVENELETTDRFELQSETSRTTSEDSSVEAGVTTSASYGKVNIEVHGNYASNKATEESSNSASTFAKDVVSRSVQKIKERVLKRRSRTDIHEVEIINKHEFDNVQAEAENIAGIYRWVNKYYEAQVVNYGLRTMLEFMIPEPAAFYRFALARNPDRETNLKKPAEPGFCQAGRFFPLKPTDLTNSNFMCFVGKYGVTGINSPPEKMKKASSFLGYKTEFTDQTLLTFNEENKAFKIPDGYIPKFISYHISGENSHSFHSKNINSHQDNIMVIITIAGENVLSYYKNEIGEGAWESKVQTIEWGNSELSPKEIELKSYIKPEDFNGSGEINLINQESINTIPVSINGHTSLALSVAIHYTVLCERSESIYQQWQIETYNAIMNAYHRLKSDYDEALQSQQFESDISIQGQNPFINREVEKTELKKHAISILTGQQYEGFNAMWQDHRQGFGFPEIDLEDAAKEGEFVQFFEQALEWRHATYLFYDYFWGRKQNWVDMLHLKDTDPLFEKFLRAGYARLWVPIRPGFDSVIGHYICAGGEPWTEKDAPQIEGCEDGVDPPVVSMIEEMKEQLDNDFAERPGEITVSSNSKVVTGESTDFSEDDVDREILIHLESYRIAQVVSPAEIRLREVYTGETTSLGVAVGVKYVGEPWVVQVPTSLVHLQEGGDLNG